MNRLKALMVTALTLAVVIGTVLTTAGVAAARVYFVPASRDVVLTGHGYGHGIGMSQYGAEGAARQGKSYRDIVGFYYPRTTLGTAGGRIRVLITADTTSEVKVSPAADLSVRDLGTGSTWQLPTRSNPIRWRIGVDRWVEQYHSGDWHRWRQMSADSEFFRPRNAPITLWVPSGSVEVPRSYRGRLRSTGGDTVNVLSLEQYLRGVVPLEMPASWSGEALKSQAVAARTYAVRIRSANVDDPYQICDTTSCQVYGGGDGEDSRTDAAIQGTRAVVLEYGGEPALTMFSASNGGFSADGGLPYLVARPDPYDGWSGNGVHTWRTTLSAASMEAAYPSIGTLIAIDVTRRDGNGQWGGRVEEAVLRGTTGEVRVSGTDLRFRFGLRSHWFAPRSTLIGNAWRRLGGGASPVGGPTGPEYFVTGGTAQPFVSGRMYWSSGSGAHEVHGKILRRYRALGEVESRLGFPRTDELAGSAPGVRLSKFEGAWILSSRATGAHYVSGAILHRYRSLGGDASRLGLPTRNEYAVAGGRVADFQHGRISWDRATDEVTVEYY